MTKRARPDLLRTLHNHVMPADMTTAAETYIRWEPVPNLPEHPCGEVQLTYDADRLTIFASYTCDPPAQKLRINFGSVEAFKAYEEFSDPWMEAHPDQPMIRNDQLHPWVWPLQEVINSRWIARVVDRNSGADGYPWRHFCVITCDKTVHIMKLGNPEQVELIP